MINQAEILKGCRTYKGLTQIQLADKSGIHQSTISGIERDLCGTTVDTFEALLNAMGFRIEVVELDSDKDWRLP